MAMNPRNGGNTSSNLVGVIKRHTQQLFSSKRKQKAFNWGLKKATV